MAALFRDAWRQVVRSRRFSILAALCAALGVAAFGAVGALFDAALVAPLPFPDAHRLVRVWMSEPGANTRIDLSVPEAEAVAAQVGGFESVAASARIRPVGRFPDGAARLRGEAVSSGYFETLGLRPALGRLFRADEAGAPVVLLSHALWTQRLGADPDVVGRPLVIADETSTIVGVMPAWFHGAIEHDDVQLWVPFERAGTPTERADRTRRHVWLTARLRDGVDASAASSELDALSPRLAAEDPALDHDWRLRLEPFGANWREPLKRSGGVLGVAAIALLLIGVANAAALLAVRARARRHELALRGALGAAPRRLALQLLIESLLVVGLGSALGLAAAWPILDLFLAANPTQLPPYVSIAPNAPALAAGALVALLAGAAAGSLPALAGLGAQPIEALAAGGRAAVGRRRRAAGALVSLQLGLTLLLLVGGSLTLRSYAALVGAPLGFERERVLRLGVTFSPLDLAPAPSSRSAHRALLERLRESIAGVAGVEEVGFVDPTLPPWGGWQARLVGLAGAEEEGVAVGGHAVDAALYRALDLEVVAGRVPTEAEDLAGARLAVVSRALAERLAGEPGNAEAALGRAVRFAPGDRVEGELTVIGVVDDVAWDGLAEDDTQRFFRRGDWRADLFVPLGLMPLARVSIAVRTPGAPEPFEPEVRRAIAAVAPNSPLHWVSGMADEIASETGPARFLTLVVDAFAAAALWDPLESTCRHASLSIL